MNVLKWLNPQIASMTPYQPGRPIEDVAREIGLNPETIIKLASNENPLGCSPKALKAMRGCLKSMFLYPDGSGHYLTKRLADQYEVLSDQVLLGSGSNEILEFIGHCFMGPERAVVASQYSFIVYKLVAHMFGSRLIEVPAKGFGHDLNAMADAIDSDTSVVFVCNPNNPTGTFLRSAEIERFLKRVPDDVLVVFDEAYAEICHGRMPNTLRHVRERPNCLVLRTFSKAYGLAGLRIGYGLGPAPVIGALQKARQPFNTTRIAQEAALAALDDQAFIRRTRGLCRQGKACMEQLCRDLNLPYEPAHANFILIKVGDGARITAELQKRGMIVRPMGGYQLPEHIRVSFGTMEENQRFAETLREILITTGLAPENSSTT